MNSPIQKLRYAAGDFLDREFDAAAFVRAWPGTVHHDATSDELVMLFCPDVLVDRRAQLTAQLKRRGAVGAIIKAIQVERPDC